MTCYGMACSTCMPSRSFEHCYDVSGSPNAAETSNTCTDIQCYSEVAREVVELTRQMCRRSAPDVRARPVAIRRGCFYCLSLDGRAMRRRIGRLASYSACLATPATWGEPARAGMLRQGRRATAERCGESRRSSLRCGRSVRLVACRRVCHWRFCSHHPRRYRSPWPLRFMGVQYWYVGKTFAESNLRHARGIKLRPKDMRFLNLARIQPNSGLISHRMPRHVCSQLACSGGSVVTRERLLWTNPYCTDFAGIFRDSGVMYGTWTTWR